MHLLETNAAGNYTGERNELYLNVLGRSRPLAIHGKPRSLTSNPDDGIIKLKANEETEGKTLLWVPDRFGMPVISGTNATLEQISKVEGGYHVTVNVSDLYELEVSF